MNHLQRLLRRYFGFEYVIVWNGMGNPSCIRMRKFPSGKRYVKNYLSGLAPLNDDGTIDSAPFCNGDYIRWENV